jgi:hypothetical protein
MRIDEIIEVYEENSRLHYELANMNQRTLDALDKIIELNMEYNERIKRSNRKSKM